MSSKWHYYYYFLKREKTVSSERNKEGEEIEILKCVCNEPFERQQQERPLLKG